MPSGTGHGADVVRVDLGRDRLDQERSAREAVGGAVRSGQEGQAADLLPVALERELLVEARRVGHHLKRLAVVDDELAAEIFEDRRIASRVGDRQMQLCALAVAQLGRDHPERLLLERGDRLGHRPEVVEHVLRPQADRDRRLAVGPAVIGFGEIEQVGDEAGLVHAVGRADGIAGGDQAAVFGDPFGRIGAGFAIARDAARKGREVVCMSSAKKARQGLLLSQPRGARRPRARFGGGACATTRVPAS